MSAIQTNLAEANAARAKLHAHCMAAKVTEDRHHVTVIFPPGYFPDGVRVTKANGIRWAYEQALIRMERAWQGVAL